MRVLIVQLPEKVWKTAADIAIAKRDEWGNPGERCLHRCVPKCVSVSMGFLYFGTSAMGLAGLQAVSVYIHEAVGVCAH